MALNIRRVEYFNTTVGHHAGEGARLLSLFASFGVSLLAFKAVSTDRSSVQFSLIPNDDQKMVDGAKTAGIELDGPHFALLIQGGDESGALADIYEKLSEAGISVRESSGIADINGWYGVVLYLTQEDCERAEAALKT
jgi:hypothetical protein